MDADDSHRNLSEKDIICEIVLGHYPVLNDWELKAGYAAYKKCIEFRKASPQQLLCQEFDWALRSGWKDEAVKIALQFSTDYEPTKEMCFLLREHFDKLASPDLLTTVDASLKKQQHMVSASEEDLYVGQCIDMNDFKISVDFQDETRMFHGLIRVSSEHTKNVSFIRLTKEKINPMNIFDFLYNSVSDFNLKVHALIERPRHSYLVAERVCLAYFFFQRKYDELKKDSEKLDQSEIFSILAEFLRRIMRAFILSIEKEQSILDFRRCTFLTMENEGRVISYNAPKFDLRRDLWSYQEFVEFFCQLFTGNPKFPHFYIIYNDDLKLEASRFASTSSSSRDVLLVLECTYLWSSSERISFIENLYQYLKCDTRAKEDMNFQIKSDSKCSAIHNWRGKIRSKILHEILTFPNKQCGKKTIATPLAYTDSGFDLLRYIIATFHHYNDGVYNFERNWQIYEKMEIEEHIHDMFPDLCYSFMIALRSKVNEIFYHNWNKFQSVAN